MARAAPSAQRPAPMGIVSYRRCLLYLEIPNLQLGETAASWERRGRKCGAVRGAVQATAVVACRGRVKTKIMQLPTVSYLHEVKVLCKAQALSPRPTPYHSSATGDNSRISTKRKNNGSTSPDALLDRPTKTPNGRGILRTIYDPKQLISSSLPTSSLTRRSHEEMNASTEAVAPSAGASRTKQRRRIIATTRTTGGKSSAAGGAAETKKKKKKKPAAVAPAAVAATSSLTRR